MIDDVHISNTKLISIEQSIKMLSEYRQNEQSIHDLSLLHNDYWITPVFYYEGLMIVHDPKEHDKINYTELNKLLDSERLQKYEYAEVVRRASTELQQWRNSEVGVVYRRGWYTLDFRLSEHLATHRNNKLKLTDFAKSEKGVINVDSMIEVLRVDSNGNTLVNDLLAFPVNDCIEHQIVAPVDIQNNGKRGLAITINDVYIPLIQIERCKPIKIEDIPLHFKPLNYQLGIKTTEKEACQLEQELEVTVSKPVSDDKARSDVICYACIGGLIPVLKNKRINGKKINQTTIQIDLEDEFDLSSDTTKKIFPVAKEAFKDFRINKPKVGRIYAVLAGLMQYYQITEDEVCGCIKTNKTTQNILKKEICSVIEMAEDELNKLKERKYSKNY